MDWPTWTKTSGLLKRRMAAARFRALAGFILSGYYMPDFYPGKWGLPRLMGQRVSSSAFPRVGPSKHPLS